MTKLGRSTISHPVRLSIIHARHLALTIPYCARSPSDVCAMNDEQRAVNAHYNDCIIRSKMASLSLQRTSDMPKRAPVSGRGSGFGR